MGSDENSSTSKGRCLENIVWVWYLEQFAEMKAVVRKQWREMRLERGMGYRLWAAVTAMPKAWMET